MSILQGLMKKKPAEPEAPTRQIRRLDTSGAASGHAKAPEVAVRSLRTDESAPSNVVSLAEVTEMTFAGVRFLKEEIETTQALSRVRFNKIINEKVQLGQHLYSRIAVAKLTPHDNHCVVFADKAKASEDEITAVVKLLQANKFTLADTEGSPQGYWATSSLVMSLSQGHIDADGLEVDREIASNPRKNALFESFVNIVAWAYSNNVDDLDFSVEVDSPNSQVWFKIGGRYIDPPRFLLPTDTMIQMLGIAWQKSSGGAQASFELKSEQQAKVELELPRSTLVPSGARVRLRWSGYAIDKGQVVTMRLQRLGESAKIRNLDSAGYPESQKQALLRVIHSEGGMTVMAGVVGSGKTTSLAQLMNMLPRDIKKISIEDPVELEIQGMYQKTVTRDLSAAGDDPAFRSASRSVYRSALDAILIGEIRDQVTGNLARSITQSGHSVYTTTHADSALGIIGRFASPEIGMPLSVLATPNFLKVLVYQALLPTNCPHCCLAAEDFAKAFQMKGEDLEKHLSYFDLLGRLYNIDPGKYRLRNPHGCTHCQKKELPQLNGFGGRTVVSEMVEPDEDMLGYILSGNMVEVTRYWRSLATTSFEDDNLAGKTAMECAIYKAAKGVIDPREIEPRFMSFETVERKRKASSTRGIDPSQQLHEWKRKAEAEAAKNAQLQARLDQLMRLLPADAVLEPN